mmetsp:Transcript_601/g.1862  ORF Transcript_601/g.1862 Transcript_601/m.1862 type:complete len:414 (+) Transcript_601:396-1637(+)
MSAWVGPTERPVLTQQTLSAVDVSMDHVMHVTLISIVTVSAACTNAATSTMALVRVVLLALLSRPSAAVALSAFSSSASAVPSRLVRAWATSRSTPTAPATALCAPPFTMATMPTLPTALPLPPPTAGRVNQPISRSPRTRRNPPTRCSRVALPSTLALPRTLARPSLAVPAPPAVPPQPTPALRSVRRWTAPHALRGSSCFACSAPCLEARHLGRRRVDVEHEVAQAKAIVGVYGTLHPAQQRDGRRAHRIPHKLAAKLADAVVVRDGAAGSHDGTPGLVLNAVKGVQRVGDAARRKAKVKVDADASVVRLRDTAAQERLVWHPFCLAGSPARGVRCVDDCTDLTPRAGRLKGLGDKRIVKRKIPNVRDAVGEKVATHAILLAAGDAAVPRRNAQQTLLLVVDLPLALSLED